MMVGYNVDVLLKYCWNGMGLSVCVVVIMAKCLGYRISNQAFYTHTINTEFIEYQHCKVDIE